MADLQKYKPLLHDNPLCGIDTYKDTLNLATGACTRQIKKLVLTGNENMEEAAQLQVGYRFTILVPTGKLASAQSFSICTHFVYNPDWNQLGFTFGQGDRHLFIIADISGVNDATTFANWLAAQYAAGTPVIVWYILATPTTETITVPTGLSGTEEGYLIQDGTPTPTNPVYPTANEVLIWQHSLRKLTTATEAIENPLYSDGTAITAYTIKGNTVQNGTPTSQNPVMPQGCGERTENLFPSNTEWYRNNNSDMTYKIDNSSTRIKSNTFAVSDIHNYISVKMFNPPSLPNWNLLVIRFYADDLTQAISELHTDIAEIPRGAKCCSLLFGANSGITDDTKTELLNSQLMVSYSDSVPIAYEPYGYKIPISSPVVTTNIYLSEPLYKIGEYADTINSNGTVTRKIKKIIFNGTENWSGDNAKSHYLQDIIINYPHEIKLICCCSHYNGVTNIQIGTSIPDGAATFLVEMNILYLKGFEVSTLSDFKQFLADQYAAGTPVTLWYVLETPTTETATIPTIPTTDGANSITVDTTVQPSEFTATWTGWHNSSVKEWDGSQWD